MTTAQRVHAGSAQPLRHVIAAEIRAELARRRISGRQLARMVGEGPAWAARRLSGSTAMDADDIQRVCDVLRIEAEQLMVAAFRAASANSQRVVTGVDTPEYPGASSLQAPALSLVPALEADYPATVPGYGSSDVDTSGHDDLAGRGSTAEGMNNADAA